MRKHDNPISRREKVHQKTLGNLTVWDQYTVLHIIYNPHHLSYVMIRALHYVTYIHRRKHSFSRNED